MQKSVILSMYPQFWKMIATGIKTIELRTTKPKCKTPFKVYVYVTGGIGIVGEFMCNDVQEINSMKDCLKYEKQSSVSASSIFSYSNCGKRKIYAWSISDVKAYQNIINISEFGLKRAPQTWRYIEEVE